MLLARYATAWAFERAAPELLVLSREHQAPADLAAIPQTRLAVTGDALLSDPAAGGRRTRGLTNQRLMPRPG